MVRITSLLSSLALARAAKVQQPSLGNRPDWHIVSEAAPGDAHEVTFVIQQQNLDQLHATLMSVSDPDSPNRGLYLSNSEVNALTTDTDAVSKVEAFLTKAGVAFTRVDAFGNYIKAKTTVFHWESIFRTDIQKVSTADGSLPLLRAVSSVTLPEEISECVAGVFRLSSLPPVMTRKPQIPGNLTVMATTPAPVAPEMFVTPARIKSFYNVDETGGSGSQSQSVVEALNQYASPGDLTTFETNNNLPLHPIAVDIGNHVDDSPCALNPNNCIEANLDVQYMIAMAPETPLTHWYVEGNSMFEDWIEQVAQKSDPPLVNSISYGSIEENVDSITANAFNTEALKLGVQGITVLVSSGDDGVASNAAQTSVGDQTLCGYHPGFPASSPYVTAVGATQGGVNGGPEVACSSDTGALITTGGGFSTKFDMPSYQADAVNAYRASSAAKNAVSGYTNGRGYPDISMAGHQYEVVVNGLTGPVDGTSASAPVVAGFASLVNAKLAAAGSSMKSVGFINPTLYKAGTSSFNDITSGNNKCTAGTMTLAGIVPIRCCEQGFAATTGWDPLTGLGSVDYQKFEALFLSPSPGDSTSVAPETSVAPSTAPVDPTSAPLDPTTAPEKPTTVPVDPTTAPEDPTTPTTAPLDPTTAPLDPTTAPLDPTTAPLDPTTAPLDPTTAPQHPTTAPEKPSTAPVDPTTAPLDPTTAPLDPTTAPQHPTTAPLDPTTAPEKPSTVPVDPTSVPVDPTTSPKDPTTPPETTAVPETTVDPETTAAPRTTVAPGTTAAPDPSLTLKQCHACLTMCAPCMECKDGSDATFLFGSCDKCWHCWNFGKDELKEDDKHMDKDCDAMHHDHDWDDHKVRCLTDSPKSSKVHADCRPCWATFGDMLGDMMIV